MPPSLPPIVAAHAAAAMACASERPRLLLVADMAQQSREPRLWIIDVRDTDHPTVIRRTQVAHGYGSDPANTGMATRFGQREGSGMTSLGLYRVGQPYVGKHGSSYRLLGLSASNANAYARNIMLHPATYVSTEHVGRSAGCAAVAPSVLAAMTQRFGTLTGALLWVDGPGVATPACARLSWPSGWSLPTGSVWAATARPTQVCTPA